MIGLLLLLAGACWLSLLAGVAFGVLRSVGWDGWWDRHG